LRLLDSLGQTAVRQHLGGQQIAHALADGARALARRIASRLGTALSRRSAAFPGNRSETNLAGVSFAQQEPDLGKEAGLTGRQVSGLAMGGISAPG